MIYLVTVAFVMLFAFITFKAKHIGGKFNFAQLSESVNAMAASSFRHSSSQDGTELSPVKTLGEPLLDGSDSGEGASRLKPMDSDFDSEAQQSGRFVPPQEITLPVSPRRERSSNTSFDLSSSKLEGAATDEL